ncbi:type II toxin-antitoxin system RelE/ParE family toxin [Actinosynnema sp. CA-299493]
MVGDVTDWDVVLHENVDTWFARLCEEDPESADLIEEAIDHLSREGPRLGRPLVDRIKGSRHHNMKELRPASSGVSEVRILFAFDPRRQAILLVAGDKSGNWRGWYERNVPLADRRFDEHLAELDKRRGKD